MSWDNVGYVIAAAASLVAVISGIARGYRKMRNTFVAFIRREVAHPVQQIKKATTENSHANREPTIPDRLEDMMKLIIETLTEVAGTREEMKALSRMFDGHLEWSQAEVDRIWRRLQEKRDK